MKIIFTVKSYWPSSGGIQSVTKYMAEGLAKIGHDVIVLTSLDDNLPNDDYHNGVKIKRIKAKTILKFNYGDKSGFRNFLLENNDANAVITVCAQSFASEWFFPIIDKIKGKKIMYMHGMRGEVVDFHKIYSLKNFFKELLLTNWWRIYFRRNWESIMKYDTCIHLFKNDSSYCYFEKNGFNNNVVIANSCSESFFDGNLDSTIPVKYGINNKYFIQVANYDENKNQLLTLQAFLNAGTNDTELVFIGGGAGSYVSRVKEYLKKKGGKKTTMVHVLTDVTRLDTIQLIKNSYATLLSSHSEYFPISIIEGMACGKPFISTAVGEVPKLIGGHSCTSIEEIQYWVEYYINTPSYVTLLGDMARDFCYKNMLLESKIKELENIIL